MPDGAPQLTQVWLDTDGEHILVNTVASHQKAKNVRRDPRVAINVHDPAKPFRIANIRGRVVEEISAGAEQHVDALAKKYMGADRYSFGQPGQQRSILKIQPERIHTIGLDGDGWQSPGGNIGRSPNPRSPSSARHDQTPIPLSASLTIGGTVALAACGSAQTSGPAASSPS